MTPDYTRKLFKSESELAKPVIAWLQDQQWEVFQEVQTSLYGSVADIVARRDRILWVIECKLSFGLGLIDQAWRWLPYAHYVSVATAAKPASLPGRPRRRDKGLSPSGFLLLRELGIGHIVAGADIRESVRPKLHRSVLIDSLGSVLREEHKTWGEAGNNNSERYSPFKATCRDVLYAVQQEPGITMKALIDKTPTHYASSATARSSLAKWIQLGKVAGVQSRREGRHLKLYPLTPKKTLAKQILSA